MVIRRIREHVTAHNWFAVAIDLGIVVLGVFLGTQVSNWNETRHDRDKGHAYRVRLIADLRDNEYEMHDKQVYYSAVLGHATAALAAFEKPVGKLGEQFLIDASQATQVYSTRSKRFTYDELVAAGDLDLLGNLGERIGTYYVLLDNVSNLTGQFPPYRERLRREIPYNVELPIRQHCSDINLLNKNGAFRATLPDNCRIGLDRAIVARGVARLRAAPELDRDLSRYVFFLRQTINSHRGVERRARDLRQIIERAEK